MQEGDSAARKVYRLAAFCAALAALSIIVPRFVPSSEGFGAAGMGILVFLGMLAAAFVVSLYLAFLTLSEYGNLGTGARVAGLAPAIVLGVGLVALVGGLRF